jgi:DNA-binding NarL/FixJ family response regulator
MKADLNRTENSSSSMADQAAPEENLCGFIVIIDRNKLRRFFVTNALRKWLGGDELKILDSSPDGISEDLSFAPECRLCILSLGDARVGDPDTQSTLDRALSTFERTPVIIMSDRDNPQEACLAFRAGAKGFLPTTLDPDLTARAIQFVVDGGTYFPPSTILGVPGGNHEASMPECDNGASAKRPESGSGKLTRGFDLTQRQQDVVLLLQEGLSNKVIARHLSMTEATVKVHVRQIMRRLGVSNRTQIALRAVAISGSPSQNSKVETEKSAKHIVATDAAPLRN